MHKRKRKRKIIEETESNEIRVVEEDDKDFEKEKNENEKETEKERIASILSLAKKSKYIFADTSVQNSNVIPNQDDEINEEESEHSNYPFQEELEEEVGKMKEFFNMYKNKKEIAEEIKVEKTEEIKEVKISYELFKDFVQVQKNYSIVKEAFKNKDFQKDIVPFLEKCSSEFHLTVPFLRRIYVR